MASTLRMFNALLASNLCIDSLPRERQYKRKIKLWGLRKNANAEDYSHIDALSRTKSRVPLEDAFMSRGIPITRKKIQRHLKHQYRSSNTAGLDISIEEPRVFEQIVASQVATTEPITSSKTRLQELERELDEKQRRIDALEASLNDLVPGSVLQNEVSPAPEIVAVRAANAKKVWKKVPIDRPFPCFVNSLEPNPFEQSFKNHSQANRETQENGKARVTSSLPKESKARRIHLLAESFQAQFPEVKIDPPPSAQLKKAAGTRSESQSLWPVTMIPEHTMPSNISEILEGTSMPLGPFQAMDPFCIIP